MPLMFVRVDTQEEAELFRVNYRDEFGQLRFFEFSGFDEVFDYDVFAQELIHQVNGLLARPRPTEAVMSGCS